MQSHEALDRWFGPPPSQQPPWVTDTQLQPRNNPKSAYVEHFICMKYRHRNKYKNDHSIPRIALLDNRLKFIGHPVVLLTKLLTVSCNCNSLFLCSLSIILSYIPTLLKNWYTTLTIYWRKESSYQMIPSNLNWFQQ